MQRRHPRLLQRPATDAADLTHAEQLRPHRQHSVRASDCDVVLITGEKSNIAGPNPELSFPAPSRSFTLTVVHSNYF